MNTAAAQTSAGQGPGLVTYFDRLMYQPGEPQNPQFITVNEMVENIRSGKHRSEIELIRACTDPVKRKALKKTTLAVYCVSGMMNERREDAMFEHSGIAVIDLDHLPPDIFAEERARLIQDPKVLSLGTSPSGDGMKVLFRIPADMAEHRRHYAALLQYVGLPQYTDKCTSDPCRACFATWDPEMYFNPDAEVFAAPDPAQADRDRLKAIPPDELADIMREAQAVATPAGESDDLLDKILKHTEEGGNVDFRKRAKLGDEKVKLTLKHYAVHAIEQLLQNVKDLGLDMCRNGSFVYLYNGAYWENVPEDTVKVFLGRAAEHMGVDFNEARWHGFRENLFRQLLTAAPAPRIPKRKTTLINLLNGTLEIRKDNVFKRPATPADFLKYQLQFKYDPQATAPLFMAYLDKVLPDKASQAVIGEFLGYIFTRNMKLEKALFAYGPTAHNGKSVLYDTIMGMLGRENVSSYSLQSLTDTTGYTRAMIADKLVNYTSEATSKAIASDVFKQLASGEAVEARLPYGHPFQLENGPKLIFNCNELPYMGESNHAIDRRLLIVPFNVRITPEERDIYLADKIVANELPGVLNWILEGLQRLRKNNGFTRSEAVEQASAEHRLRVDSVMSFLDEQGLRPSATKHRPLKDLFNVYRQHCIEGNHRPCSQATFSTRLQGQNFTIDRRSEGRIVWVETDSATDQNVF
jgi:putative DNA primase/helicase